MPINQRLIQYAYLMRLDKPIGILLLLWPTLWALLLASQGELPYKILIIFVAGVILMRSAGCVLNDMVDREIDKKVKRTRGRPLANGQINRFSALLLAFFLLLLAFLLVLQCNKLTVMLAFAGLAFAVTYPFLKRVTYLPQLGLGLAFSWGVPMAFAAVKNVVDISAWFLFITCLIWPVIYDTMYAMVDKVDDIKIGVKSTAILFASWDNLIIGLLQVLFIILLLVVGMMFHLNKIYYSCLGLVAILFCYQQWLIKDRHPQQCFNAFLNNNWVGLLIFLGILFNENCC